MWGRAFESGERVSAQIDRLHAGLLGDLGIERRVDPAGEEVRLILQQPSERLPLGFHAASFKRARAGPKSWLEPRAAPAGSRRTSSSNPSTRADTRRADSRARH